MKDAKSVGRNGSAARGAIPVWSGMDIRHVTVGHRGGGFRGGPRARASFLCPQFLVFSSGPRRDLRIKIGRIPAIDDPVRREEEENGLPRAIRYHQKSRLRFQPVGDVTLLKTFRVDAKRQM